MTHVHYKFSSKLSYDTAVFDGPHITLRDLKRQIMGRERLRAGDCDLQITNAQSKEEYTDDEGLIPKGSSVIVRRIPVSGGKSSSSSKTNNIESSTIQFHHAFGAIKAMDDQSSSRALPFFSKMANLAEADVSEEDKIKVMLNQSTYDCMNYNKKFGTVLPSNYTCYRCGNTGHHIRNCPTSGQDKNLEAPLRIKKSTGIPRSFMVEVDDPNMKGAMLTNSGRYAIPAIDAEAYAIGKKEKPPFILQEKLKSEAEEDPVPDELLCLICRDLMSDAVVIPCCGNSYCDDCIRTTLLDSEEHVCPTCSQSDVSPDTLIANKFLRQAVNNFKKERGYTKSLKSSCGAYKSQSLLTTRPSPVPTPPPITGPSQPQKPHQPTYSQIKQDSLQPHPNVADTLPLSGAPPVATDPTSVCSTPSTSIQPEQSCLEMPNKEAEEKTQDDSAAAVAAPSVLVSNKEPTAAPSQLIPVVNPTVVAEQPQSVSMNRQQSSSSSSLGATPSPCGPPTSWDSSSSGHPTRGWTESQQLTSSSSTYSATTPPLFPSPHFLSAYQSHHGYPPGYQPTTPLWPVPSPQGAPIPSLCSSISTSSIPSLIPDEWYMHQRKKNKRSPHRGSTYKRSSSRSNSKSSKSKSSHSYSNSSSRSRSRSRSRSQSRPRHQSSHSRHRDLHTRPHLCSSYSYGYKRSRSPTPSSSSSPQVGYYSRSKSPSDYQKRRHHSRHQNKKSSSGSCNPRKRGECSETETGGSEAGSASHLYAQHSNHTASADLDRERYLQWKNEYKEWCDKYFSSYVGHFHQLPLPPPPLPPPPPPPQWVDSGASKNHAQANSDPRHQPQGRRATQMDGHSPSSQSYSDSQTPTQSSRGSHSTTSQSFSDSVSSPSSTSNNSHSPPSQSSSDGRSTPSEDGTQSSVHQQRYSHLPVTPSKDVEEDKVQKRTGSTDGSRRGKKLKNSRPNACKDGTSVQDGETTFDPLKSIQPFLKPNKSLDKNCERESREQRNSKGEKRWRRGVHSDSRQDVERPHKVKPSREADRVDTDRYRSPGDRIIADTRSDNNRKRKGEELERNKTQRKSESPDLFDRKKQKNEKKKEIKTQPLTVGDIWEEGIKVKPQKKISININLDGKREKHDQELSCSQSVAGKTKEEDEKTGEEKLDKGLEAKAHEEFSRDKEGMCEGKLKPGEANKMWEKSSFREVEIWDTFSVEEENTGGKIKNREHEDFDLWHCALKELMEEKERKKLSGQRDGMKTSKGEEVTGDDKRSMAEREGEVRRRNESQGQETAELAQNSQKEGTDGKSMCDKNREIVLEEFKAKRAEEPMEGVKRTKTKKEENTMRCEEQMSRYESHRDGPNTAVDDGRCMDHQERRAVMKTLEEYTQDRATVREGERLFIKAPLSKWDKLSGEEEQDKEESSAKDALPVWVPPPLFVPANQETERENEPKRWRSVDTERNRDSQNQRGRYIQKDAGLNRTVAPSSGKYRTDSTLCADRERERKMELEGWRDRERRRESERPRDRQKENKRSKEKKREEDKGRHWVSEREHSSTVSAQRRNHLSSGPYSSSSESHYFHPSGKVSGSERSSISRAVEAPDKNAYKIHRDASVDSKSTDRNLPHDQHSRNYHHQDRPAGTHHSTASFFHNRDTLSSESFGLKPRMSSPGWELMQNRSRNESKEAKGEWKLTKVDKVMRDSKSGRETRERETEREGGSQWVGEAKKLAVESKWEERRELEEGERSSSRSSSSSSSSSASLEYKEDDGRKERKKHKKHRREKRRAVPELLEEVELKKRKKSKKHSERSKEESGGEVDDRVKEEEEEDPTRRFSVMLS